MKTFVFVLVFFLSGCSNMWPIPSQTASPEVLYKRDMIIKVNGVAEEGVIVMPMLDENKIHVQARGDLDAFSMTNCAGENFKEKAWNVTETVRSGLFGWGSKKIDKKREVTFSYFPTGLEKLGACPLELSGFSKAGKHSWGFVDFKTSTFELQGKILCNGVMKDFDGVFACQSRAGLFQQLKFKNEVFMSPDVGCELDKNEGAEFTFQMPKGICVYRIKERESGRLGKLTLIGYSDILIRED